MRPQSRITLQAQDLLPVFLLIKINPILNLIPKMSNESLHRPRGCIPQSTNRVSLNLPAQLIDHIDLSVIRVSDLEALHYVGQPGGALATGRALTTGFVFVEFGETKDRVDYVGLPVHYDYGCGAEA